MLGLASPGVADRFDVVATWVTNESTVVPIVVLRPQPGLVQDLGAQADCGVVERPEGVSVGSGERHVDLTVGADALAGADPEVRLVGAVADRAAEAHEPAVTQGRQHGVIERDRAVKVGAADAEVIDLPPIPAREIATAYRPHQAGTALYSALCRLDGGGAKHHGWRPLCDEGPPRTRR